MLGQAPWLPTLMAGTIGSLIAAEVGRTGRTTSTVRVVAGSAGFLIAAGAFWLIFEGLLQVWRDGGWTAALGILGVLLIAALSLRWADERWPAHRGVASYCADWAARDGVWRQRR